MINFYDDKTKRRISRIIVVILVIAMAITIMYGMF